MSYESLLRELQPYIGYAKTGNMLVSIDCSITNKRSITWSNPKDNKDDR